MTVDRILDRLTRVAEDAHLAQSNFRIPYDRDDERYEYIEQGHMFFCPSDRAGWEQIICHNGMPGEPTSPCFYVWRRLRRPTAGGEGRDADCWKSESKKRVKHEAVSKMEI